MGVQILFSRVSTYQRQVLAFLYPWYTNTKHNGSKDNINSFEQTITWVLIFFCQYFMHIFTLYIYIYIYTRNFEDLSGRRPLSTNYQISFKRWYKYYISLLSSLKASLFPQRKSTNINVSNKPFMHNHRKCDIHTMH